MKTEVYRYRFGEGVSSEDVEAAILLSIWACESLRGESQTRMDATHFFDTDEMSCVIDAGTDIGMDFNRLFVGFLTREIGPDAFRVERVKKPVEAVAA
ncbi:hypothetical protein [Bremerella sp. P1]|uniref:hypothetical protein n=1 Tax=Bremerella sp. P1 TaxID=3026424 RepID=UPI002368F2D8|nr:hypothetical protein [Bremerella sp. P1]WDI41479.1 hypothetical protein PSR63_23720 [Bremerella sp. P1]